MNTKLPGLLLISLASLTALSIRAQTGTAGGGGRGAVGGGANPAPWSPVGGQGQIQPGQPPAAGATGQVAPNGQLAIPTTVTPPGGILPQTNSATATQGVNSGSPAPKPGTPLDASQRPTAISAPSLQRDQAISATDQTTLGQIRQTVFPPRQPAQPWMSSVHFILKDGAVRLVGSVPTEADRQRIEATVQQTPGVTRVYDVLTVDPSGATAPPPATTPVINGNPTTGNGNTFTPTNIIIVPAQSTANP